MRSELVRDIKESVCKVFDTPFSESQVSSAPPVTYELPDTTTLELTVDRFSVPEALFNPTTLIQTVGCDSSFPGLAQAIADTISKADVDIRRELYANIIVTGGSSLFTGLPDRLQKELLEVAPANVKVKLIALNSSTERKFGAWIGGSILGSLGSFQQMWMSRQEYQEHGAGLVERKCP
eukprot:GILI01024659.1.p1 GENE.GILI01024659.1~~GILI01024659.1.p1  ORF type:complete len:179 (-),score=55.18 GILI01024659.1:167-703(-)